MKKIPSSVAASMPETTTVPMTDGPRRRRRWRPQRNAAEDERERRHEDGAEPQARALERGVDDGPAFLELGLRELDDEDRVLRGEADQHDEADLRIDVVVEMPRHEAEERAQHRHGHAEEHAEGSDQLS